MKFQTAFEIFYNLTVTLSLRLNEKLPPAQLVPNAEHACLWQGAFRKTELFSFLTSTSFCVTRMPTNLSTKIGNLLISSSLAVYEKKREVWILLYFVWHKLNSILNKFFSGLFDKKYVWGVIALARATKQQC